MTATYTEQGDIAVITLNNPPVNGLGHATRTGIVEGIAKAADKASIKAVVIIGEGRGFSGGADIREFNSQRHCKNLRCIRSYVWSKALISLLLRSYTA